MDSIENFMEVEPTGKNKGKSIFIWIDILGFSEAVEEESRYNELSNVLAKFKSCFDEGSGYKSRIISDGIVLQISPSNANALRQIFKSIGEQQYKFICENKYFVRGGIAIGTIIEEDKNKNIIGNGLARAVKMESKHVNWPVIGTNKKTIEELQEMLCGGSYDCFDLAKAFNANGDDLFFIDFIAAKDNDMYYAILNQEYNELSASPNIRNKYIWLLRHYHHKCGRNGSLEQALEDVIL